EVTGITGTNGKTTTAQLVHACIDACGGRSGVVGTLGCDYGGEHWSTEHTSPEADELMRVAAAMRAKGATHLLIEGSALPLAAARVAAVRFRVAAFTNLTQDHLDFHGSMDAYAAAKRRLFVDLAPAAAAVNVDDPFGRTLAIEIANRRPAARIARFSASVGT